MRRTSSYNFGMLRWLFVLGPVWLLAGCFPAPAVPMPRLEYQQNNTAARNLLILMRGIGASNKAFEANGLIEEIRRRNLPFDIIAPDAHFGYYRSETLQERLHEDIILPARRDGYQKIWLAGFSMGGLGSLFYLRDYPDQVDGVMLICPFLGWSGIVNEIEAAGGLNEWTAVTEDTSDWQRLIWSWIKHYSTHKANYPPIYLGFGDEDFVAGKAPALFARSLQTERAFSVSGGHSYTTFKKVFKAHLDDLDGSLRNEDSLHDPKSSEQQP